MASKLIKKIRSRIKRKEWLYEVVASKKTGIMSDRLATMFVELVYRCGNNHRYKKFVYNDDMQSYALTMLCRTWHKFNPKLSDNPYAFYMQCIKGSFCQFLNREKREIDIKAALEIENASKDTSYFMVDDEQHF